MLFPYTKLFICMLISPLMCCIYFHVSVRREESCACMRYHHILVSMMGSHCYGSERGNYGDPSMIFCRKKIKLKLSS